MMVRRTGVNFLMNNPERFIESNTDIPWASYLSNMSHQDTWADHLIIQAVADAMNLIIQIIESNETFSPPNKRLVANMKLHSQEEVTDEELLKSLPNSINQEQSEESEPGKIRKQNTPRQNDRNTTKHTKDKPLKPKKDK